RCRGTADRGVVRARREQESSRKRASRVCARTTSIRRRRSASLPEIGTGAGGAPNLLASQHSGSSRSTPHGPRRRLVSDVVALGGAGAPIGAVDRAAVRAVLLRHSGGAAGCAERGTVIEGDAVSDPPHADAAFLDPDRRPDGRRTRDPSRFEPPPIAWTEVAA